MGRRIPVNRRPNEPSEPLRRTRSITNGLLGRGGIPTPERAPDGYVNARGSVIRQVEIGKIQKDWQNFKRNLDSDPTFRSFRFRFLHNTDNSPLLNGTAEDYLRQRGRDVHADLIQTFSSQIEILQEQRPWYFSSYSDLDNVDQFIRNVGEQYSEDFLYHITLSMWEDLDWRVQDLIEFYKRAVYDYSAWKYNLPENLRKFEIELMIGEARNIREYTENQPFKVYRFRECELLIDSDLLSSDTNNSDMVQFTNQLHLGLGFHTAIYQSGLGLIFSDEDLERSQVVEGETIDEVTRRNQEDLQYTELLDKRGETIEYPPSPPFELPPERSLIERLRDRVIDAANTEVVRLGQQIEGRINRQINSVIGAVRTEAQNMRREARFQVDRRLNRLMPDITKTVERGQLNLSQTRTAVPDYQGNAQSLRDREENLTDNLANYNVYEGALALLQVRPIIQIGNVYDR